MHQPSPANTAATTTPVLLPLDEEAGVEAEPVGEVGSGVGVPGALGEFGVSEVLCVFDALGVFEGLSEVLEGLVSCLSDDLNFHSPVRCRHCTCVPVRESLNTGFAQLGLCTAIGDSLKIVE